MTNPAGGNSSGWSEADLDRLVREVLSRLSAMPESIPAPLWGGLGRGGNGNDVPSRSGASKPPQAILVVDERVVTAASIAERLTGITQLHAPRGAVITPAARDLLREQGVSIAFATASVANKPAASSAKTRIASGLAQCTFDPTALVRWLGQRGHEVEQLAQTGLKGVAGEMAEQVAKGGALGLVWTNQSAAAICLGNRQRGVRAALAASPAYVSAAVASVGANLLVVDPAGRSFFELRQTLAAFVDAQRSAAPHIPID